MADRTPKRKRVELTVEQKREMCLYWQEHTRNSKFTQARTLAPADTRPNCLVSR